MKKGILIFCVFLLIGCIHKKEKWVFMMAGQSNMAGRGIVEAQDTVTNSNIFMLNKEMKLVLAKEPLHFYEPKLDGLDCGLSFAKELHKNLPNNIDIVLVPCAVGGSSISQWLGDSLFRNVKLYSNFKKRMEYAKSIGSIKGILWHQGESDAHQKTLPLYRKKLQQLFKNFRHDAGNDKLPILVGELGNYAKPEKRNKNWKTLNSILHKIAEKDTNIYVISSVGLTSNPDKVHFNSKSQRKLGKRFAKQFIKINKQKNNN
ncbi:sialate O-acetylesterase [Lutibacter sp.]|uniref:sialate O-acetylesterase n=1 Tax=Lutibacter sp. TaxID=1925666 RepID=UPI0025B8F223|nr:sialate O-acetylesterase [Lutibacter sp.]MCF6180637.1 sialate O-acetylesterase [Lutibacter sp.]